MSRPVRVGDSCIAAKRRQVLYSADVATGIFASSADRLEVDGKLVIWRFVDGKRGHENQTAGLIAALAEHYETKVEELSPFPAWEIFRMLTLGSYRRDRGPTRPDLVVGAGHSTHFSVLAARRAYGGRAVVLMKPSLPLSWFDLCLIPEHDRPPERTNVVVTRGVLNTVKRSVDRDPSSGLILIGGPSKHFDWDDESVLRQVTDVVTTNKEMRWLVTDSRRTSASMAQRLASGLPSNAEFVPNRMTHKNWLPRHMGRASVIWSTPDSVSMVYEALTSGASVGLFQLSSVKRSRVARGIDDLRKSGAVTDYVQWQRTGIVDVSHQLLNEAGRCAYLISSNSEFLPDTPGFSPTRA